MSFLQQDSLKLPEQVALQKILIHLVCSIFNQGQGAEFEFLGPGYVCADNEAAKSCGSI